VQQLGDDQVGEVLADRLAQEDDALGQQAAVDVEGALAASGLLDDHRYQWHWASIPRIDVQLYGCVSNLAHTVERSILLDAPPEEVWEALTDPAALREWLAPEVELDPREGGELLCRYEDGEERRGEVELVEEAERLAFRWWREDSGPSRVELVLEGVAEGTRLTVVEPGLVPVAAFLLAASWAAQLARLRLAVGLVAA
jgi:uncharacterized protein YndB with AHSA1/START domain